MRVAIVFLVAFLIVIGLVCLGMDLWDSFQSEFITRTPIICDWCGKEIKGKEGTQIKEYWLHDKPCYKELDELAETVFGNEYSVERMEWIIGSIKEK